MYGAMWCGDCRRAKRVLDAHGASYRWLAVEVDPDAAHRVREINGGRQTIPTILFPDGAILVEPSDAELRAKLSAA